ncbi:MAG: hypothetical protein E6J70_02200 [Deltaproteobacteria bacterium]|nr:MAG: hypothetical protein E6J70_02200 [Deltaproteobacteria bacterium]
MPSRGWPRRRHQRARLRTRRGAVRGPGCRARAWWPRPVGAAGNARRRRGPWSADGASTPTGWHAAPRPRCSASSGCARGGRRRARRISCRRHIGRLRGEAAAHVRRAPRAPR